MNREIESATLRARAARAAAVSAFERRPSGREFCRKLTAIADNLVAALIADARKRAEDPGIAVVATGGYGRRELAPKSDIDITFIPPPGGESESEAIVRELFRLVVDAFFALDWPVGYAFRLPSDCPTLDSKTRSGLMDARLVAGSGETLASFRREFDGTFPIADFIIEKLEERDELRRKWHDTPRVVEFHLRDGAGGLRDAHTAGWLSAAVRGKRAQRNPSAYEQLLLVRNALHIVTGRKQDVLARTRLGEVARIVGCSADEVVASVVRAGEQISALWNSTVEACKRSSFPLAAGVNAKNGACHIASDATLEAAVIGVCRAVRLGLAVRHSEAGDEPGDIARAVGWFTRSAHELRALDRAALLARLFPELHTCMELASEDSVHKFSVGEHTLRVVERLDELKSAGTHDDAWSEVTNPRPLVLAALLHDVGKKDRSGPHSETGARIAETACDRLGVSGDELETVVWLVRHHLDLAQIARTHDLAHPSTYVKLVRECQRSDRLAMLYLLTLADTASVAPGVLTPHMEASLGELYEKARNMIGGDPIPEDPAVFRSEAERRLRTGGYENVERLLRDMPTHYLLATPTDLFPLHAEHVRRAAQGETLVHFQNDPSAHTTEITICTRDLPRPGLLSRIFGVIYALDVTVHAARAASTGSSESIALDTITASYQGGPLPKGLCRILSGELQQRLDSANAIDEILRAHGKDPEQGQAMLTYTYHEGRPGILEFQTPPGRGMPYRVAKMLAEFGWNVSVARMGVYGDRAVARFYVELPGAQPLPGGDVERRLGSKG